MSEELVTVEREVWLLIGCPRKAAAEIRYCRILSVHTSRRRAERAKAKLPFLVRRKSHIEHQLVEVTGPGHLPLSADFTVDRSGIERVEYAGTRSTIGPRGQQR